MSSDGNVTPDEESSLTNFINNITVTTQIQEKTKPENIRIELKPFNFCLPKGQKLVKNPYAYEFWN